MRLSFLFSLLITATFCFPQSKTQLVLADLERQRFEAMTTRNVTFLKNVLSDDLAYTHSNGLFENKQQHLENITSGALTYRTILPEEMQVRLHGRAAVITGIVQVTGTLKDKEFALRLRYTDFYVKKCGKWRLAGWQSMRLD